jgi:hypothetical protein
MFFHMELELSEERIRTIIAHLAHLRAEYGEAFEEAVLVEPNGEFFPDEFALDAESVERLMRRMLDYVPLSSDLEIGLGFIQPDGEVTGGGGGCGSGACGTGGLKEIARGGAVETEEGYAALVHVQDVGDPTILTTALARSLGRIVLFEADEDIDPRDEGALSELTAVASGLGLLLLNGACVYKKGCGGMKRHQATFLDVEEIAMSLAVFVRMMNKKPASVRKHLEVTQKEVFDAALDWVDSQPSILRALAEHPETLSDGVFAFEEKKGLLSRLFSRKDESLSSLSAPASNKAPRRQRSEEEERRLAEAKALVDEALSES